MPKKRRFDFTKKNKRNGKVENVGYLNLEQDEEQSRCSLYFYGDIVSATWESMWYEEDRCPQDIADFLNQLDGYEDIDIYFNSGGGDDKNIHDRHVTLWDLGENDENFSDDDAEGVTLSVQVTIFSENDEVELAREIKSLMKENDFSFDGRNGDDSKPEDGIYMKAQRFSKFYEMEE